MLLATCFSINTKLNNMGRFLFAIVLQGAIITIFSVRSARNFTQTGVRFGNCKKYLHKHVFPCDHTAGSIVQIASDS